MKRIYKLVQGKGKMIKLTSLSDAGHGWLSCKRAVLVELGILDKVTAFSYERGNSVYLEEDCDAGLLIKALESSGKAFKIIEGKWQQYSRIRSYNHFTNTVKEEN